MIPVNATIMSCSPKTTAVTVPINLAVTPLQKHHSFEEPTNIEFTAETLPRI
jgi:hypothetical protein